MVKIIEQSYEIIIRTLMRDLLEDFKKKIPIIFDDIVPTNPRKIDRSVLESD